MGAAASLSDYVNLNDEQKEICKIRYKKLIDNGKTEDEAINELKQPQLLVKTIELTSLLSECEYAVANGKTPLVIDNSNDSKVDTFFSYRSMPIIDGKKMGLDKSIRKIPVPEIMEEARKKLSLALKIGMPLIIAMTKSVTDFTTTFNDSIANELYQLNSNDNNAYLPIEIFDNGGKKLLSDKYLEAIIRKGPERNDIGGIGECVWYICVCLYECMYVCLCMYECIYMYAYMYVCMHA